jgi:putative membrane protein
VVLVIGGLVFVLLRHRATVIDRLTGPSPAWGGGRARAVLEERYARGEISTQEFQERLHVLRDSRTVS